MDKKKLVAPCSSCLRKNNHDVLYFLEQDKTGNGGIEDEGIFQCFFLSCAGCSTVSMAEYWMPWRGQPEDDNTWTYYPSPISRMMPQWISRVKADFRDLLEETYSAVNAGQHRLAAMGIRALVEH